MIMSIAQRNFSRCVFVYTWKELCSHGLKLDFEKSYLFDGNFVSFTPLNADPRIQVVQLARSQGNGLQIMFVFKAEPISFSENMCVCHLSSLSPCSRACLSFGSRASPSALVAWKMPPIGNLSKIFNGGKQKVKREMSSLLNCLLFLLVITLVASTLSCLWYIYWWEHKIGDNWI